MVGVLELLRETVAVLEHYLPDFFSGLSEVQGDEDEDVIVTFIVHGKHLAIS